jgi:molybdate transport system regulatory protein
MQLRYALSAYRFKRGVRQMKARSKVWLANERVLVFGEGKARILEAVARTGSLSGAARELKMSYRHAWSAITAAETRLGQKLINRSKGGRKGGGAELTAYGKDLLKKFNKLDTSVRQYTDRCHERIFGKGGQ